MTKSAFTLLIPFTLSCLLISIITPLQVNAQFAETIFYDTVTKVSAEGYVTGGYSEGKYIYLTGGSFSQPSPLPSVTKMDTSGKVIWTGIDPDVTGLLDNHNNGLNVTSGTTSQFIKDGDRIYTTAYDNTLWCLSDSTGAMIWKAGIPGDLVLKMVDYSSTEMLVLSGRYGLQYTVISKQTGNILYSRYLVDQNIYAYKAELLLDNNKNILVSWDYTCYKYRDRDLQQLVWQSELPYYSNKSIDKITQDGDHYIFSGLNNVQAVDTGTGTMIWYNHILVGFIPGGVQSGGDGNPRKMIIKDSLIYITWVSPVVGGVDLRRAFTLTCINKNTGAVKYNVAYDFTGVPPDPPLPNTQEELDWPMDFTLDANNNIYITGSYDVSTGPMQPANWGIMKINGITGDKLYEATITTDVNNRLLASQGLYIEYKFGKLYAAGNLSNPYPDSYHSKPVLLSFDSSVNYHERFRISPVAAIRYPSSLTGMAGLRSSKMALLKMVGRSSVVEMRNGYNELIWRKTFNTPGKFIVPQMIKNLHDTSMAISMQSYNEEPVTKAITGTPDSVILIRLDTSGNIRSRQQIQHEPTDSIAAVPIQIYTDAYNRTNIIYRRRTFSSYFNNYSNAYFSCMLSGSGSRWDYLTGSTVPDEESIIPVRKDVACHFSADTMLSYRYYPGSICNAHVCSSVQAPPPVGYKGYYLKVVDKFTMIQSSLEADSSSQFIFGRDGSGNMLISRYNFKNANPEVWFNAQLPGTYFTGDTSAAYIYAIGKITSTDNYIVSKINKVTGQLVWTYERNKPAHTSFTPLDFRYNNTDRSFTMGGFTDDSSFGQIKKSYSYVTLDSNGNVTKDVIRTGDLFGFTKINVINNFSNGPHFYGGILGTIAYGVAGFYNADCFSNAVMPAVTINTASTTVVAGNSASVNTVLTNSGTSPSYQWQDSTQIHTWQNISTATGSSISYKPQATNDKLRCIYTSNTECAQGYQAVSNTLQFTVTIGTAVDPLSANSHTIKLYPNPVKEILIADSLRITDNWQTIEIIAVDGKQIMAPVSIKNQTKVFITTASFQNGMYTAILRRKHGPPVMIKFIKL